MGIIGLVTRFLFIPLFAMMIYGALMLDKLASLVGTPTAVGCFIASIYLSLVGFFHSPKLGFLFAAIVSVAWVIFWNIFF